MSAAEGLPPGWQLVRVGDVANYVRGVTYSKEHARGEPGEDLVPVLRANNIGHGLNFEDLVYVPSKYVSDGQRVRDGDVVFAMSSGSKNVVGKAAQASSPPDCGFGAFCGVLRPLIAINHTYFGYYFQTKSYRALVSELSKGVNINNLKAEHLLERELPLAPRAEQDRVASKIDELFSDIEEGERALERVQKLVERYRQSVLKAAVTGELTREWRETAGVLRSAPHKSTRLPPGWVEQPLGSLAAKVTSGSRDWKNYYGRGDGVFIMAQNVRPGRLDLSDLQVVDPPEGSRDAIRSEVQEGDLLITIVGANTGDVCRVDRPLKRHYVCQSVAMIRLADPQLAPYVELFLMAEEGGQAQFGDSIYGAGRPHLSFDQLKSVLIPVPPADEQAAIIDAVQRVASEVDATMRSVFASERQAVALRQAVLAAAFRGELAPQDPTDEPASTLLAGIPTASPPTPARSAARRANTRRRT